jgi:chaperonin GroES
MTTRLTPLNDRVIVRRIDAVKVTDSGIIIPDTVTENPDRGIVVSVGPGKHDSKGNYILMNVTEGDEVLFSKGAGTEIQVDGEALLVLVEADLFAIIK